MCKQQQNEEKCMNTLKYQLFLNFHNENVLRFNLLNINILVIFVNYILVNILVNIEEIYILPIFSL